MTKQNSENKIVRGIKNSFVFELSQERTGLILVVANRNESYNKITKISCYQGCVLGGYAYDTQSDCYVISCVDYVYLGDIPFSLRMFVEEDSSWSCRVPVPSSKIKKYLSNSQKRDVKTFFSKFNNEDYLFYYIQVINPN